MERILVVEDDENLARGTVYALEKEGWEVELACTVAEAFRLIDTHHFDLLLLDVMLPDGSGFDICQRVRAVSAVPILFLTARDEEVNVVMGLDLGADDYIIKPFRIRELTSRIRAGLRRGAGSGPAIHPVLRSGDLTLYPLERKVTCQGRELQLTAMEYRLLATFMENPLQVLTRDQLLERLWGVDQGYIDENTLAVYVRRLREKVEPDPSHPAYILTVRGLGYRWNQRSGIA
ncbi:MAG TPA: response regulator transcription factor [Symbiobacteriaceae bacterium]|nr:response regulator transcription factor [Symbiobacteriaceae bacterium]